MCVYFLFPTDVCLFSVPCFLFPVPNLKKFFFFFYFILSSFVFFFLFPYSLHPLGFFFFFFFCHVLFQFLCNLQQYCDSAYSKLNSLQQKEFIDITKMNYIWREKKKKREKETNTHALTHSRMLARTNTRTHAHTHARTHAHPRVPYFLFPVPYFLCPCFLFHFNPWSP